MAADFSYETTADGRVRIFRGSAMAVTLAGRQAQQFLRKAEGRDAASLQRLMASSTGQYRFGNERQGAARRRDKRRTR